MNMAQMARSESYQSASERKSERYLAAVAAIIGSPIDEMSSEAERVLACFDAGYATAEAAVELKAEHAALSRATATTNASTDHNDLCSSNWKSANGACNCGLSRATGA